ncbi:MAG: dihydropteroate synthase [Bradyrhizobium sp.]
MEVGKQTLVMGILNITPDSFSDGAQFFAQPAALDQALRMLDEGADMIDIGGESTRPSSTPISAADEQARVLPVIRSILAARPDAILSIDTYHAETARAAVDSGVEIVNDVSGHLWDPAMSATCAELRCGNVLMHTRGRPSEWKTQPRLADDEVLPLVLRELAARADAALVAGIARETIVLDPGFGFGKIMDENLPLLAHFDQLHSLGFPLLAGLSRKSFLKTTNTGGPSFVQRRVGLDRSSQSNAGAPHLDSEMWEWEKDLATSAANMAALLAGAHILRVHEVAVARQVAALADKLLATANSSHT